MSLGVARRAVPGARHHALVVADLPVVDPHPVAERAARLQEALNAMDPIDREVLSLRHFEQLTSAETAQVLGIQERAAAKRYLRAMGRLSHPNCISVIDYGVA